MLTSSRPSMPNCASARGGWPRSRRRPVGREHGGPWFHGGSAGRGRRIASARSGGRRMRGCHDVRRRGVASTRPSPPSRPLGPGGRRTVAPPRGRRGRSRPGPSCRVVPALRRVVRRGWRRVRPILRPPRRGRPATRAAEPAPSRPAGHDQRRVPPRWTRRQASTPAPSRARARRAPFQGPRRGAAIRPRSHLRNAAAGNSPRSSWLPVATSPLTRPVRPGAPVRPVPGTGGRADRSLPPGPPAVRAARRAIR